MTGPNRGRSFIWSRRVPSGDRLLHFAAYQRGTIRECMDDLALIEHLFDDGTAEDCRCAAPTPRPAKERGQVRLGPDGVNNTLAALACENECSSWGPGMCGWRLTSAWLLTFASNSRYHRVVRGALLGWSRHADVGAYRVEVVPSAEHHVFAASPPALSLASELAGTRSQRWVGRADG